MKALRVLLILVALLGSLTVLADERILSFESDIKIAVDASILVTETMLVRAEGDRIRRGIVRDFPTDYRDRFGNRYRVGFELISVQRDGLTEFYRMEQIRNGVRIYIGRSDVFLEPGEYEYRLSYRTSRQLGFFEDHDELYWNVNGNDGIFPIDRVSARVVLPERQPTGALAIEGYVGRPGSAGQSYEAIVGADGVMTIATTRALGAGEGLTLVASWPKGVIDEPTAVDEAIWMLSDNRGVLTALITLVAVLSYLIYAWHKAGRDPVPGVIFPHYEPPERFSPASVRYVSRMAYDMKTFTAAVIDLAVKGFIEIDEDDDEYTLRMTAGAQQALAPGEKAILGRLFRDGGSVTLKNVNHKRVLRAIAAHKRSLRRDYHRIYFMTNSTLMIPAIGIVVLGVLVVFLMQAITPLAIALFAVCAILVAAFFYLMKAPTKLGRRMLDKIDGFRLYLDVAEKEDLELRNPPEKTPELFEAYLPYALALGVEQSWAEQFTSVFERLKAATGQAYRPIWYHGHWNSSNVGKSMQGLTAMTSSLGDAISSSASPPGSSSGVGGGGVSGGGGGGGGVGGW